MTNKEILEGNKLISEFMGVKIATKEEYAKMTGCPTEEIINMPEQNVYYHSSWDWLMEVIDKIESLEGSNPFKDNPKVKFQGDHVEIFWYSTYRGDCIYWKNYTGIDRNTYQHKNQEDSRILAAFRAIIEFIKWYNKKNDKN